jgi:competence protein ComEA
MPMKWTRRQLEGIIAIAACLAVFTAVGFLLRYIPPAERTPPWGDERSGPIITELTGTVGEPGIYFMPEGATIAELLRAAHVPGDERFHREFLSSRLERGMRVTTGSGDLLAVGEMSAGKKLLFDLPLDVNKATHDDLLLVPGIGESIARRIIDWRQTYGKFTCIEELTCLPGIKEKKLSILRQYLVVQDVNTER